MLTIRRTPQLYYSAISADQCVDKESPIVLLKACKNASELQGMRACHLRDGAAVVEFLAWLDDHLHGAGAADNPRVLHAICFVSYS